MYTIQVFSSLTSYLLFHINRTTMSNNLEKLLKDGFADLKAEMRGVKEEVQSVRATASDNTKKIEDQASELADLKDQVKHLITNDQDHRRRAGRR